MCSKCLYYQNLSGTYALRIAFHIVGAIVIVQSITNHAPLYNNGNPIATPVRMNDI